MADDQKTFGGYVKDGALQSAGRATASNLTLASRPFMDPAVDFAVGGPGRLLGRAWSAAARSLGRAIRGFRDSVAYARVADNPAVLERASRIARMLHGRMEMLSAAGVPERITRYREAAQPLLESAIRRASGDAAVRGAQAAGPVRYTATHLLGETIPQMIVPKAGRGASYVANLRSPQFLGSAAAKLRAVKTAVGTAAKATGGFLGRGAGWVRNGLVRGIEASSTGLTGGFATKVATGIVKNTISKAGLAAGFATQGVLDTGRAIMDFADTPGSVSDAVGMGVGRAMVKRSFQGLLRGVDGVLLGLVPNRLLKAAGADSESYFDPDMDQYAPHDSPAYRHYQRMEAAKAAAKGGEISAAKLATLSREYQEDLDANWLKGLDAYGRLETKSAAELARRKKSHEGMEKGLAAEQQRRANLLYDYDNKVAHPEGPDVRAVAHALEYLRADHDRRASDLAAYDSRQRFLDEVVPAMRGDRFRRWTGAGGILSQGDEVITRAWQADRDAAYRRLGAETDRQFSRIRDFAGYGALLQSQADAARQVYTKAAWDRGYTREESGKMFDDLWQALPEYQRATLDLEKFGKQLTASRGEED